MGVFAETIMYPSLYAYLEYIIIDTATSSLTDMNTYLSHQRIPVIPRILSAAEYRQLDEEMNAPKSEPGILGVNEAEDD